MLVSIKGIFGQKLRAYINDLRREHMCGHAGDLNFVDYLYEHGIVIIEHGMDVIIKDEVASLVELKYFKKL